MRRILLCAALLSACKAGPLKQLPSADWQKGTLATVHVRATQEWEQRIKPPLEEDLRTAGFRIVADTQGQNELEVTVGEYDGSHLPFTVERGGERIDQITFQADSLDCQSMTLSPSCIARE